jgi:peptidoglycan hydrolase FlgJ
MIRPVSSTPAALTKPDPELRKAAEAFEAVILRQLIGSMRSAKLADEMFGSNATNQFRELADARTAESMAAMRKFGIAALVEKQLTQAKGPADA